MAREAPCGNRRVQIGCEGKCRRLCQKAAHHDASRYLLPAEYSVTRTSEKRLRVDMRGKFAARGADQVELVRNFGGPGWR